MSLPDANDFIGENITELEFKNAQKDLLEFIGNAVPSKNTNLHPVQLVGAKNIETHANSYNVLIDGLRYTDNCYIGDDGQLIENVSAKVTEFIPISFGFSFVISKVATYVAAVYDSNFNFIKVIKSASENIEYILEVESPEYKFIRFNIIKSWSVEITGVLNKYSLDWFYATPENIGNAVSEIFNSTGTDVNLIENVNFIIGGYIDNNNVIHSWPPYSYSAEYILVDDSKRYVISFAASFVGVCFDKNQSLIGSIASSSGDGSFDFEFDLPKGTKFIKINISNSDTVKSLKEKSYSLNIKPKSAWQNKKIAWYGTSIPAGYPHSSTDADRDIFSHANLAVHDLGASIINKCVPAGGIGLKVGLSFARTTDAINYQNSLLNLIGTANEPDLIVFDYGVNDYDQHPSDIDAFNPNDSFNVAMSIDSRDENTFIGAHNKIIDQMLSLKPDMKFSFITHFSNDNANPNIAKKQDFFKQMNIVIKAIADYWSAPILNLHEKTGYRNRSNFDSITPVMPDHIHPASGDGRSVESLRNIVRSFLISIA